MQEWLTLPLLLVAFLLSRTSDTNYTNKATAWKQCVAPVMFKNLQDPFKVGM